MRAQQVEPERREPAPDLDFLEYLGAWAEDDDEWLAIEEWRKDNAADAGKPEKDTEESETREMTTMKANRLVAISIALLALAGTAAAQGVAWQDLSDAQRRLLAPHEQRWADLTRSASSKSRAARSATSR